MRKFARKLKKLISIITSYVYLKALLNRSAAAIEHEKVLSIRKYSTIIDIGANRGQFALVSRKVHPNAKIISFEPLNGPAKIFKRVFKHDDAIKLVQAAISPMQGEVEIHISNRDDSSSLLPITTKQDELFPGTAEIGIESVETGPLGKYVKFKEIVAPALLKLDVQGYELDALKGSEELLERFDSIYVECSFMELYKGQALAHEVISYLSSHRFYLDGIYNLVYDRKGQAIQGDFLFKRN